MKKYIRAKNNKFLLTDDNWKNFRISEELNTDVYKQENNNDKSYRVVLAHQIGCRKRDIILKELKIIRKILKDKNFNSGNRDGYGLAFEVFSIAMNYSFDYSDVINDYIVHGSNDGKVDAVVYLDDAVHVYQIKTYQKISIDDRKVMKKNIQDYVTNKSMSSSNTSDLKDFLDKNWSNIRGKRIIYKTISGDKTTSNNIKPINIYNAYILSRVIPQKNNNLILTIPVPLRSDDHGEDLTIYNIAKIENSEYFLFLKASKLINAIKKIKGLDSGKKLYRLFYDNVRGKLSKNNQIEYTLENEPAEFCKYNNGISITGVVNNIGHEIIIKSPAIVNGQQTLTNIYESEKSLDKVYLPVFIKNINSNGEKASIATYNNTQKPIKALDLLSIKPQVREIQDKLLEEIMNKDAYDNVYYLNIYSSGKTTYLSPIRKILGSDKIIKISDFVKLYFSHMNPQEIGLWKNSVTRQLEKQIPKMNKDFSFDVEISKNVCKAINAYKLYLQTLDKEDRGQYRKADLALQYILLKKNFDIEYAVDSIDKIIETHYTKKTKSSRPKSLADIFRNNDTYSKLKKYV